MFYEITVCLGVCVALMLMLVCILYAMSPKLPVVNRARDEKYFLDEKCRYQLFGSLMDPAIMHLSVIIPAYNEVERLPEMLDKCLDFLKKMYFSDAIRSEVLIVSDGSTDATAEVAHKYTVKYSSAMVRVLKLVENRGKGGAVRLGMLSARGAMLLFADADGATKFSDLEKLFKALTPLVKSSSYKVIENIPAIVVGSRAHLEEEAIASRSFFRNMLMHGFHSMVSLTTVKTVKDTQCGFKLFTRAAARICFSSLHVEGWAFDVELLYIAEQLNIPIVEVAVNWQEIGGSKIVPVLSWLQMGRDVLLIWLKYRIGAWKINDRFKYID